MQFHVYNTTNPNKSALYIGVTNNREQRIIEHYLNRGSTNTFAGKYYCYLLVFYQEFKYVNDAIAYEKELKKWRREKKLKLITDFNPDFIGLNTERFGEW